MMRSSVILFLAAGALLSAADFKEFKKTVPLDADGAFSLDTYKGSIRITAWDQTQVDIQARIVADSSGWFPAPVDDVEIRVDGSRGSVRVKTEYRREHWSMVEGSSPDVQYTIRLPRNARLSVKDYKSDTDISGVQGAVEFETYKGTARLNGLRSPLELKTYKGDVRASFVSFMASSRVETYKGTIDLSLPKSAGFEIHTHLERHAAFDSDFPRTIRSTRQGRDFNGAVNGGGPQLSVTSYRGNIRLRNS